MSFTFADVNSLQTVDMTQPSSPQPVQPGYPNPPGQILYDSNGNGNPLGYPYPSRVPNVYGTVKTLPDAGADAAQNVSYPGWISYVPDGIETYNNIDVFTSGEGGLNLINKALSINNNPQYPDGYPDYQYKAFIVVLKPGADRRNIINFYPIRAAIGGPSIPRPPNREGISFNFYDNSPYIVRDANQWRLTKSFTVDGGTIWPPYQDPNNLALTTNIMGNNVAENTIVGVLSTSEITSTDFMYSIIAGDDSDKFYINGSNLYANQTLLAGTYTVIIESTLNPNANPNNSWGQTLPPDPNGFFDVSNTFVINISSGPYITGIDLTGNTITEKQPSGKTIGIIVPALSAFPNGWMPPISYTAEIVGESSNFQIVNNELKTLSTLNYINAQYYTITVKATVKEENAPYNIASYIESFLIDVLPQPLNYDLCMNSHYWSSNANVNYYEDDGKGVVQILPAMGTVELQFKNDMRAGFIAVGAGGGGGGGQQNIDTSPKKSILSGGGGGGGSIYKLELNVFQDMSFNLTAGDKGSGGTGRLIGSPGGATLIKSDTTFGTIDISAGGGNGGTARTIQPDGSGGILVSNISANTAFNFEERELFKSSGYEISRGGRNNDSNRLGNPSDLTIIGQDGSGAVPGIQQLPGRVTFLGVQSVFSGGGGGGYFDISSSILGSTDGLGGQGGRAGNGYGGFGGKILTDSSNSPLIAGISAEIFGAGGGGAGSNYNKEYSNPPDFVKGGSGGDGVILIYYQVPPASLNKFYFTEYEFFVNSNIIIDPYIALPQDISSIDISGVDFLNINEKGIITNKSNTYPTLGKYKFDVIIDSVSSGINYDFITLDISNTPFNQYYNNNYKFRYGDLFGIYPNTFPSNIADVGLSTNNRSMFNIDNSGNIGSNIVVTGGTYYMTVSILFNNGSVDSEYFEVIVDGPPPPPPPPISNRPGPIQFCNSRFAYCNITKKSNFSSGNVTIQGATLANRVSTLIRVQSQMRNAKLVFQDVSLNVYGQKAGGPYGYGSSPKNTF
jgi:hypothetical protein